MIKLNFFLTLILIISALGVVTSQHKARKLFIELENERGKTHQLKMEWGQLLLEQSTLAMHGRVEAIAGGELNMKVPTASHVQIVTSGQPINSVSYEGVLRP